MVSENSKLQATIMKLATLGWTQVEDKPYMMRPPARMFIPPELHVSEAAVMQHIINPGSLEQLPVNYSPPPKFQPLRYVKAEVGTNTPKAGNRPVGAKFKYPSRWFKEQLHRLVWSDYLSLGTWTAVRKERGDFLNTSLLWRVGKKGIYSPTVAAAYVEQGLIDWDG